MSMINFMLSWVEHENSYITSGPGCIKLTHLGQHIRFWRFPVVENHSIKVIVQLFSGTRSLDPFIHEYSCLAPPSMNYYINFHVGT